MLARSGNFTRKVDSHFHAKAGDGKTIVKNGFPQPEGETRDYTSDDWQAFYVQVRRFLVNYTKEHVCPRFENQSPKSNGAKDYPQEEVNPEDTPF